MDKGSLLLLVVGIVTALLGLILGAGITFLVIAKREEKADLDEKDRHFREVLALEPVIESDSYRSGYTYSYGYPDPWNDDPLRRDDEPPF